MSAQKKLVLVPGPAIEPDLKAFIDQVLVPMLVADALKELSDEIRLAPASHAVAQSSPTVSTR